MSFNNICFFLLNFLLDAAFSIWNAVFGRHKPTPPIVDEALLVSAKRLAADIRCRRRTSVSVVEAFASRIREINPTLNCFVADRFAEALKEAAAVDARLDADPEAEDISERTKPFLGVPFTSKDFFAVKGLPNTCGLFSLKDHLATEDAEAVARIRDAGAIVLGLTNVPELCWFSETGNTIHGRTNNPYDNRRIAGGSSGGEACLISAGGSVWGLGSDIGGSIRSPAFHNGVFGHKPTRFMVPNRGQFPWDPREDAFNNTGPICRYAEDLLPMLKVLAGKENSHEMNLDIPVDLKKIRLRAFSFGLTHPQLTQEQKSIQRHVTRFLADSLGASTEERELIDVDDISGLVDAALVAAGAPSLAEKMALPGETPVNPFSELLLWFVRRSHHTLPCIFFAILEALDKDATAKFEKRRAEVAAVEKEINSILGDDGILLCPTAADYAYFHHQKIYKLHQPRFTMMFNLLGFPVTQVPLGLGRKGVPLGLQVVAGHGKDGLSIAVARHLEEGFGGWVPP